jgi:pimeloyl-ACP methyl ester carboxylesterase
LLWSHGIFGGHDNVPRIVRLWIGDRYRVIAPSRFGYFGSTLPAGATPADQADVFAALLDSLGADRVVVVGFSAGAPAALQLALRHPHRVKALILASGYLRSGRPMNRITALGMRFALGRQTAWWLLHRYRPRLLARIMGVPSRRTLTAADHIEISALQEELFPTRAKTAAVLFDALVSEPASHRYPIEKVAVPTLLIHAQDDPLAAYDHAVQASRRIPGARLVTIPMGGHLFLGQQSHVRDQISRFIDGLAACWHLHDQKIPK